MCNKLQGTFSWCPDGCGKSIVFDKFRSFNSVPKISYFKCLRCNKSFTKSYLLTFWSDD